MPWVFDRRGKPIRDVLYSWRKACAAARKVGRIPHDFRRTRVRDLVNAGVPEKVVMEWTGHLTREVFDRYHIVTAEDPRRAMALVQTKAAAADNVVSITQRCRELGGVPEMGDSVTFLATIQRMQYHPWMFQATNLLGGLGLDALP